VGCRSRGARVVRTFASRSFFHTFDLLLAAANPNLALSSWSHDGVGCARERHSFAGGTHKFAVEVVTLTRPGRHGWTLMVVKEFWWAGNREKEPRSTRWAQLPSGRRDDALGWMRKQQERLDGGPQPSTTTAVERAL
jgi:hypothetical protein